MYSNGIMGLKMSIISIEVCGFGLSSSALVVKELSSFL